MDLIMEKYRVGSIHGKSTYTTEKLNYICL